MFCKSAIAIRAISGSVSGWSFIIPFSIFSAAWRCPSAFMDTSTYSKSNTLSALYHFREMPHGIDRLLKILTFSGCFLPDLGGTLSVIKYIFIYICLS